MDLNDWTAPVKPTTDHIICVLFVFSPVSILSFIIYPLSIYLSTDHQCTVFTTHFQLNNTHTHTHSLSLPQRRNRGRERRRRDRLQDPVSSSSFKVSASHHWLYPPRSLLPQFVGWVWGGRLAGGWKHCKCHLSNNYVRLCLFLFGMRLRSWGPEIPPC